MITWFLLKIMHSKKEKFHRYFEQNILGNGNSNAFVFICEELQHCQSFYIHFSQSNIV